MKNFKNIIFQLPEYYILTVIIFTDYTPPFNFNPVSIGLSIILLLQIIFKNRMAGMFIATLFLLINVYMPFALMWEYRDFTGVNSETMQFLLTGFSIILLNLFFSALMIYKYLKEEEKVETDTKVITNPVHNRNTSDESERSVNKLETEQYQ